MLMLRTLLHGGALSKEEFTSRRDRWLSDSERLGIPRTILWITGYASWIEEREEAEDALAHLPSAPDDALQQRIVRAHSSTSIPWHRSVDVGRMYLLAGRVEEALPFLQPSQRPCFGPGTGHTADFALGQALDQKGDKAGACIAYAAVIAAWDNA